MLLLLAGSALPEALGLCNLVANIIGVRGNLFGQNYADALRLALFILQVLQRDDHVDIAEFGANDVGNQQSLVDCLTIGSESCGQPRTKAAHKVANASSHALFFVGDAHDTIINCIGLLSRGNLDLRSGSISVDLNLDVVDSKDLLRLLLDLGVVLRLHVGK